MATDTISGEQTEGNKRKIAAVTRAAKQRAEMTSVKRAVKWPKRGDAYNGIEPGDWRFDPNHMDDTRQLPADCPVRPLGYEGENYFLIDTLGQVFNSGDKALGVERMQKLFAGAEDFLCWAWPSWSKGSKDHPAKVIGFKAEEARRDLFAACAERGPWSMTDMVRGRGAWLDDRGRLILHCGEFLWVDGKPEGTGELGEHFYARRPKSNAPWAEPVEAVEDNPAVEIVEALRSWNFVRGDLDVMLQLGWAAVAMMGAALEWRPSVFIVGDAGAGKSELHKFLKSILGRGMISTTNATSAGLYQLVGHDNLPICIDELEGEDGQDQAQQIIKMARDAATGSVRIRGGANHQGVEFQARSTFLFSAINPPPLPPASLSRLALLQLRPLATTNGKAPRLTAPETIGPKLLRRVADHFHEFAALLDQYRGALALEGHSSRGQDTFGTFLAAAHLLLGDDGFEMATLPNSVTHWATLLRAEATPEVSNKQPNWSRCIDEILTSQVDAWNKGERRTIGQIIEQLQDDTMTFVDVKKANEVLAIAGLAALPKGLCGDGYALAVPHEHKQLNKLLADSTWMGKGSTGGWGFALSQAPDVIVRKYVPAKAARGQPDKLTNRQTIAGVQKRCLFISLDDLRQYQETLN